VTLRFLAGDIAPQQLVYSAPLGLGANGGAFTLSFATRGDSDRFLPIPDYSSTVLPAVVIAVHGAPASMSNRETSSALTLALASAPLDSVTVSLSSDLDGVVFEPAVLTFTADAASLSQSFVVHAPYWHAADSFAVSFDLSGADALMFSAPEAIALKPLFAAQELGSAQV